MLICLTMHSLQMYRTCKLSLGVVIVSNCLGKESTWGSCGVCSGLVLTLDDEGKLRLSYMGTDPAMSAVDIRHGAEVDYAALESEYREVAGHIKAVGITAPAPPADHQLLITAQVPCLIC